MEPRGQALELFFLECETQGNTRIVGGVHSKQRPINCKRMCERCPQDTRTTGQNTTAQTRAHKCADNPRASLSSHSSHTYMIQLDVLRTCLHAYILSVRLCFCRWTRTWR